MGSSECKINHHPFQYCVTHLRPLVAGVCAWCVWGEGRIAIYTTANMKVESAIGARRIRSILKSGMCSLTTFLQDFFCSDDGFEQWWPTTAQNRRQNKKILEESSQRAHVLVEIWSEGAISLGPRSRTQPYVVCMYGRMYVISISEDTHV